MTSLPGEADRASNYNDALSESHVRLSGILRAALDCIVTVDAEGRVLEFNPSAEKTFGYVEKEIIGRDMAELVIPPAYRAMHHAGMRRYLASGEARMLGRRIEIMAMRADQSEFPCELTITHLQIAGLPVFTAFLRDITERKKSEEDVQRLNASLEQQVALRTEQLRASMAALEQTHDRLEEAQAIGRIGDIEIDLLTQKRVWSDQVFLLYSFPRTEQPPPIEQVVACVHPTDQPAFRRFLDSYIDQRGSPGFIMVSPDSESSLEYRVIRNDGSIMWLLMTARAKQTQDGKVSALRITVQDITRRKTLERELLATIDQEQELSRLKTSFLQMITHEYRTPLGIITSSAQILERYFDRLSEEQRLDHLQGIQSSARRLANLLEDVLFLGKTDSGLVILQPTAIELATWLHSVAAEVIASLGAERTINVTVEPTLERVLLDERLLRHIMNNLISNALKYSTLDQPVFVTVHSEENWLVLNVRDQGIGIPAADTKRLFQMFQRASNVGTISGSGLGLVIVKRCVDLHRGSVEIHRAPRNGTEVIVRLPKAIPAVSPNL